MQRLLLVYGTTDGQTAKIMRFLDTELRGHGATVTLVEAADAPVPTDLSGYDGVIVAGSVHVGGFQRPLRRWVRLHRRALHERPHLFLAVCLGVLQKDPAVHRDLERILAHFTRDTGWQPSATRLVAGALAYTRYGFFRRWAMQRIARKAGGGTDTTRDYEYTDWEELRGLAVTFLASLRPEVPVEVGAPASAPGAALPG